MNDVRILFSFWSSYLFNPNSEEKNIGSDLTDIAKGLLENIKTRLEENIYGELLSYMVLDSDGNWKNKKNSGFNTLLIGFFKNNIDMLDEYEQELIANYEG